MNRKVVLATVVAIAAIALAVVAYVILTDGDGGSAAAASPSATPKLMTLDWDRSYGSANAPVQVIEYAAPSCPVCAHWDMTVYPTFKKRYVDTGKVRYIFRVFPLRSVDVAVEAMARCLPTEQYFPFIDMMYHNQAKWDPDGYKIPDVHAALITMGKRIGMSAAKADACINDKQVQQKITNVGNHASRSLGVNSTPSFFVDGQFRQMDFMTVEGMEQVLDAELKRAGR